MFIEEFNPNIMVQELNELHGYEIEQAEAELNEVTPEDWAEFSAWLMEVEPEVDLDRMFEYFFPE